MAHSGRNGLVSRRQHQIVPSWSSGLSSRRALPGSTDCCGPGTSLVQRWGMLKMRLRLSKLKRPNAPYLPLGPAQHKATGIRTLILVLASNSAGPSSPGLPGRSACPRARVCDGGSALEAEGSPRLQMPGALRPRTSPRFVGAAPQSPRAGQDRGGQVRGGRVVRQANSPAP